MIPQDAKDKVIESWAVGATLAQRAIRCSGNKTSLQPAELERLLQATFAMGMTIAMVSIHAEVRTCPPEELVQYIQDIYLTECGDSGKVIFHTDEA